MGIRWIASLTVYGWFLLQQTHGYSSGAPSSQCSLMTPIHSRFPPKTTQIPYQLTAIPDKYRPGEEIIIQLTSAQGNTHKGFLVRTENSMGDAAGTMIPGFDEQKTLNCGANAAGITHSRNTEKQFSSFKWRAPASSTGDVTFYVTVVQDYTTFWVRKVLLVLSEAVESTTEADQTTESTAATTHIDTDHADTTLTQEDQTKTEHQTTPTPLPQTTFVSTTDDSKLTTSFTVEDGKITFDPECGSSKGCFVKCDGRDCQFMVTWRDLGAGVKFEIYGRPDGGVPDAWVAVGFSAETKMGEDSVTECVHTSGMVQAFNSYNPGYSNTRLPNPQMGLSQIQGNYINGVLMCSFVRDKRVWNIPQVYDLEQDWHIMYANGRALSVPAWSISMHSLSQDNYPQTSAVRVDYQSFVVVGSGAKYPLVKAHGCLMILAWVFFTGVGIVTARYYKNVWVDKSFMKLRIWFQVHRFSMIAAVLCNTIAFIIIFVEVGGYSNIPNIPGKSYLRSHPILGIIITILSITNPIMAFLRPDPEHSKRSIFNWAHWGVGMAAYILSIISICFGFQLGKSHTPEYAIYIMIVYVIYIIMFDISLETMEIMAKRDKKGKVEQVEMSTTTTNGTDSSIPNGNSMSTGKNKKTDRTKTILLAVHFAFTGAFALVLVLVIALN